MHAACASLCGTSASSSTHVLVSRPVAVVTRFRVWLLSLLCQCGFFLQRDMQHASSYGIPGQDLHTWRLSAANISGGGLIACV